MIPSVNGFLPKDFEIREQPTHTYKMSPGENRIHGFADDREAMCQAIYKILLTERYGYVIYSGNYGIETLDLYGQPVSYVCPELKRRITEALTWDERVKSVDGFSFDFGQKGTIHVTFTVHTVFGDIVAGREVGI